MSKLIVFVGFLGVVIAGFILSAYIVMFIWNILASYFGFKLINAWIALVIVLVLTIISSAFKK